MYTQSYNVHKSKWKIIHSLRLPYGDKVLRPKTVWQTALRIAKSEYQGHASRHKSRYTD